MKGEVSGWKRLSNGGVIESKIWPTFISSNRAVSSISTASTKEYLWRMTVYQKFSPTEKGIEWGRGIIYVGEESEKQQRMALSILGRGAERVQKVAVGYWCHCDFKKRVWCSASRGLLRCESIVKLKEKLPRMLHTQTCLFPLALTLLFAFLSWPFGFTFHVIADVAIGFCEVTPIYARMKSGQRICREGKVTDHKERQHIRVNL